LIISIQAQPAYSSFISYLGFINFELAQPTSSSFASYLRFNNFGFL